MRHIYSAESRRLALKITSRIEKQAQQLDTAQANLEAWQRLTPLQRLLRGGLIRYIVLLVRYDAALDSYLNETLGLYDAH